MKKFELKIISKDEIQRICFDNGSDIYDTVYNAVNTGGCCIYMLMNNKNVFYWDVPFITFKEDIDDFFNGMMYSINLAVRRETKEKN
jgi:hypothetical protein